MPPPLCGPAPVTTVPVNSTAAARPRSALPITTRRRLTIGRAGASDCPARRTSTMAFESNTIESRKWVITNWGFRSNSTVSCPSTACARTPATNPIDSAVRSFRLGIRTRLPRTATITATDTRPVKSRLTCSIVACSLAAPWACSRLFGQLIPTGHPRPELVRRTAAPVTMITASSAAATNVIRRYAAGLSRRQLRARTERGINERIARRS